MNADLGEKVWWCEEHNDARWRSAYNTVVPSMCSFKYNFDGGSECRMVERILIPIPKEVEA